jgi:hypothetical protein
MRRTTPLLRALRALVALVTVWCLGCSGYESVLSLLLGSGAGAVMTCGSETAMGAAGSTSATSDVSGGHQRVLGSSSQRGFACGCGSCHAASPVHGHFSTLRIPLPAVAQGQPAEPAAVSRVPLVPPPESAV